MGSRAPRRKAVKATNPTPPSAWDYWTVTRRRFLGYVAAASGLLLVPRAATQILDGVPAFTLIPDFSTWVRRKEDLVSIHLDFYGLILNNSDPLHPTLVPKPGATESFVVATFWPQNVAEETFDDFSGSLAPGPSPIKSILANQSRLAFTVPNTVKSVPLTYDSVLQWMGWIQRVTPVAQTTGPRNTGSLTEPSQYLTAIEVPYRLILSPSELSHWTNVTQPVVHNGWTELWHTRMDDADPTHRLLRAVWDRDPSFPTYISGGSPPPASDKPFTNMDLEPADRANAVLNSATDVPGIPGGPPPYTSSPLKVDRLMLTALGGWIDSDGIWEGIKPRSNDLEEWRQRGTVGRDHYVKVVHEGYLFPFGHPAVLITISERKFNFDQAGVLGAYLRKRLFLVIRKPDKQYSSAAAGDLAPGMQHQGRAFPLRDLKFTTLVTPDLDPPSATQYVSQPATEEIAFVAKVGGQPFLFHGTGIDWGSLASEFATAVVFVPGSVAFDPAQTTVNNIITQWNTVPVSGLQDTPFGGQRLNFAEIAPKADTSLQAIRVAFGGEGPVGGTSLTGLQTADQAPFYPTVSQADVRLAAAEQVSGGQLTPPTVKIAQTYIDNGFGGPNVGQIYIELVSSPVGLNFGSDKSGGAMTPNMSITGLSRGLGPVGDNGGVSTGNFNPASFFAGSNPKILGGLPLVQILAAVLFSIDGDGNAPDDTPKMSSKTMFKDGLVKPDDLPAEGIHTTYKWKPKLQADPLSIFVPDTGKSNPDDNASAEIDVDITTDLKTPGNSTFQVKGDIQNFTVNLFGTAFRVLIIHFKEFKFTVKTGASADVSVEIDDVEFDGVLKFINDLKNYMPSTGAAPSLEVGTDGIKWGYTLAIPSITTGQFNLFDMSLGASMTLPFGDMPVRFRFEFCTRDKPFKMTIYIFGGGGFLGLGVGTDGFEIFEAALEFGVAASIDLGIASGSAKIVVGIYFKLEEKAGPPKHQETSLTGYFRAHGEVSVMGIISISLDVYLGLTYEFQTDKVTGTATVTISVHIVFFSISASVTVERKFGGAGDPKFTDAIPNQATWNEYAGAFASLAA
jgi:hypothetical protein